MSRGKYGTFETEKTEKESVECVNEIYNMLINDPKYQFENYEYKILDKLNTKMGARRDNPNYVCDETDKHYIIPDSPTIILLDKKNPKNFYMVLTCEDKYQKTMGNAIERLGKNFNLINNSFCSNVSILPYIFFYSGKAFFKNNSFNTFIEQKLYSIFINLGGNIYEWSAKNVKSIHKKNWNLCYFKKDSFTIDEKRAILKENIEKIIAFYKTMLS